MSSEGSCRKIQKNRLKAVAEVLVDGLEHNQSEGYLIHRMTEEDSMWKDGLQMSECPTDLEVDDVIQGMKLVVIKLVV